MTFLLSGMISASLRRPLFLSSPTQLDHVVTSPSLQQMTRTEYDMRYVGPQNCGEKACQQLGIHVIPACQLWDWSQLGATPRQQQWPRPSPPSHLLRQQPGTLESDKLPNVGDDPESSSFTLVFGLSGGDTHATN